MKKLFIIFTKVLFSIALCITPVFAKSGTSEVNKDVQVKEILRGTNRCIVPIGPYSVYVDITYTYRYDASYKSNVITGIQGGTIVNQRGFTQITNIKVPNGSVTYGPNNMSVTVPFYFYGKSATEARGYSGNATFRIR